MAELSFLGELSFYLAYLNKRLCFRHSQNDNAHTEKSENKSELGVV